PDPAPQIQGVHSSVLAPPSMSRPTPAGSGNPSPAQAAVTAAPPLLSTQVPYAPTKQSAAEPSPDPLHVGPHILQQSDAHWSRPPRTNSGPPDGSRRSQSPSATPQIRAATGTGCAQTQSPDFS